ncbi:hypothetical protein [Cohaesibacter gelatinilyticus]|uniref:Uncharacterized protein n=1 Tax=Cohaesibacter gelatinilyticus TaxID=372072 RepID=A0A285PEZ8_9HYPH|nr:hypothetical protein [Cohaesibacter gelatinilyticus]SNZ20294.1 hypothetical protein SAMN06265368_3397 [Cohaesibacter gelatinilyticus]
MSTRNRQNLISFTVFACLTVSIFLLTALPQSETDTVVVFVFPGSESSHAVEVIARAGGYLMNSGSWPWIALASSSDPDFVNELYRAGALFVGSGRLFSACFPNPISPSKQSVLTISPLRDRIKGFKNARLTNT